MSIDGNYLLDHLAGVFILEYIPQLADLIFHLPFKFLLYLLYLGIVFGSQTIQFLAMFSSDLSKSLVEFFLFLENDNIMIIIIIKQTTKCNEMRERCMVYTEEIISDI